MEIIQEIMFTIIAHSGYGLLMALATQQPTVEIMVSHEKTKANINHLLIFSPDQYLPLAGAQANSVAVKMPQAEVGPRAVDGFAVYQGRMGAHVANGREVDGNRFVGDDLAPFPDVGCRLYVLDGGHYQALHAQ